MTQKYFDKVKDEILLCSTKELKPLSECPKTMEALKEEKKKRKSSNPYIALADSFQKFIKGEKAPGELENSENPDWYFYMYLKTSDSQQQYLYPLTSGEYLTVDVDLLHPYEGEVINPRWHLFVSYYAYIDAAFNHMDNPYAGKILEMQKEHPRKFDLADDIEARKLSSNIVLKTWLKEAVIL